MIFDVALITKEAERDFRIWHSDTERFKLPAQGWTESLWQPRKPKVVLLKPKRFKNNPRDSKTTQGPTLFAISAGTHQGASRQSSVEKSLLTSSLFLRQKLRKQRLATTLLAIWAKISYFRNLLRRKIGFHQLWPNSLKKEPNVQISWLESCLKFVQYCSYPSNTVFFSLFNFSSSTGSYSQV